MARFRILSVLTAVIMAVFTAVTPALATPGASTRTTKRAVAAPVRLRIPAIGLDERLLSVGLDAYNRPIVPKHNVGWYNLSAKPGQGDNVVMWGHVLRWKNAPRVPAPFARLQQTPIGALVSVVGADGQTRRYRVTRKVWVLPSQVKYILPVGSERLTLVSCIGDNVIRNGELTKKYRLVTIAMPVR